MQLEVHLIQSFAPSCLNRDDTNTPKSCVFGGYRRARVSSQCLKRAMRLHMRDVQAIETGTRTRLLSRRVGELLVDRHGRDREASEERARLALQSAGFASLADAPERMNVGLYLSDREIDLLAAAVHADWEALSCLASPNGATGASHESGAPSPSPGVGSQEPGATSAASAEPRRRGRPPRRAVAAASEEMELPHVKRAIATIGRTVSAADIALFGRMVAQVAHMEVDAAAQVAHAISTHEVDIEMDFFTAVDDLQSHDERGAGMMGVMEFQSACFYRYAVVHREQLIQNLGRNGRAAAQALTGFVRAAIEAIPTGRQNGSAALNPPDYIQVTIGDGMPRSLANAFERPVRPNNGHNGATSVTASSIERLEEYQHRLDAMYGAPDPGSRRRSATLPTHSDGDVRSLLAWVETSLSS